jgi:hypothetical protein
MKQKEQVVLDKDYYDDIEERLRFLDCLEACGVDNWGGYDDAREMFEEEIQA